jgi:beta-phosphoglucomutase
MPLEAVLLDFDGVIFDSEPMHEAGLRAAFERVGMSLTPELNQQHLVGFADRDAYRAVCALHGRQPSDEEFAAISGEKWAYAQELMDRGEVKAFPGTLALIREVHAAGLPLGICSGARRREILRLIKSLGIEEQIRFVISADDVSHCKPHPEPYLRGVEAMGAAADRCITVEDTDKGVASAKAAGIFAIAVGHTLPRERLSHADLFVPDSSGLCLDVLRRVVEG